MTRNENQIKLKAQGIERKGERRNWKEKELEKKEIGERRKINKLKTINYRFKKGKMRVEKFSDRKRKFPERERKKEKRIPFVSIQKALKCIRTKILSSEFFFFFFLSY